MTLKEIRAALADIEEAAKAGDDEKAFFLEAKLHFHVLYGIAHRKTMRGENGKATDEEVALEALKSRNIAFKRIKD